jgi:HSP20 family protein
LTITKGKETMSNVAIHRENEKQAQLTRARDFPSPFRLWRDMLRWDPFAQMLPGTWEEERALFNPDFDIKETKEAFIFKADLPGVENKDIDVQMSDNRLTISGKRSEEKEEKTDTTYRCERSFGSFSRAFTLPSGVDGDKVDADLKNGVLTIKVVKKPEAKSKQVSVKQG